MAQPEVSTKLHDADDSTIISAGHDVHFTKRGGVRQEDWGLVLRILYEELKTTKSASLAVHASTAEIKTLASRNFDDLQYMKEAVERFKLGLVVSWVALVVASTALLMSFIYVVKIF